MKVCILTSSFPRFKKDHAGIFIYHLSMWLAKKGVEVVVISPHDNGFAISERWDGIRIIRFPYFFPLKYQRLCYGAGIPQNVKRNLIAKIQIPLFIISEIIFSLWVIKKLKMDIIHAHWSLPQGLTGLICKNVLKVACVTTLHGSDIHGLRYPILKSLNAKIIKNSDICTANSGATAGGGAGVSAAQMVAGKSVQAVLTGNCGPNAFTVLEGAGIKVMTSVAGTVQDAVRDYKAGKYEVSSQANVRPHSGKGGGRGLA